MAKLLNNGLHPHAYYYKPLSAFSAQTGGCVRCYPGAYEIWDVAGTRLDDVPLLRQGRRASVPHRLQPSHTQATVRTSPAQRDLPCSA